MTSGKAIDHILPSHIVYLYFYVDSGFRKQINNLQFNSVYNPAHINISYNSASLLSKHTAGIESSGDF